MIDHISSDVRLTTAGCAVKKEAAGVSRYACRRTRRRFSSFVARCKRYDKNLYLQPNFGDSPRPSRRPPRKTHHKDSVAHLVERKLREIKVLRSIPAKIIAIEAEFPG